MMGKKRESTPGEEKREGPRPEDVFQPGARSRFSMITGHIMRHPYATIALVGVLLSLPLLIFGYPFNTYDTVWHTLYYKHFSAQLWSGELYPRWLYMLNGGYGGPTFFYYPPTSYYFTSIFHPLQLSIPGQLGMGAALGLILSGINSYLWLKEITSAGAALISTIIYLLMPYYVYDIYGRGAFAESFALAWMPLILFFVVKISRGKRLAILGLAVSYALLCTTHLLTTMMFSAIPLIYILILSDEKDRLKNLAITAAAMALGFGLSAVYLLPAMTYQGYVWMEEFTAGAVYFEKSLMTLKLAVGGSMRYFWFIIPPALVSIVCFLTNRLHLPVGKRREQVLWMGTIACCVFMMLYVSRPVWYFVRPLQMLQFPWRFNAIIAISILPLIGFAIASFKRPYTVAMKLTTLIIAAFVVYSVVNFWKTGEYAYQTADSERIEFAAKDDKYALDVHAFWPRATDYLTLGNIVEILSNAPHADGELAKAYFPDGGGTVRAQKWQPRMIDLETDVPNGGTLTVSQFYYPGWRARVVDTGEELQVGPTQDFVGLMTFTVPPGRHTVSLRLEMLWPEYAGWMISGASVLIGLTLLCAFLFLPRFRDPAVANQLATAEIDEIS